MKSIAQLLEGRKPFCVQKDCSVLEVAKLMAERNVGAAPVLDGDRLVGIFSERDLLKRVIASGYDPASLRVADVMTTQVVIAESDESLDTLSQRMKQAACRHIPVVKDGRLVGVLSLRDLLLADIKVKEKALKVADTLVRWTGPTTVGIELVWKCLQCGHHEPGKRPPEACANCQAPREEFVLVEED